MAFGGCVPPPKPQPPNLRPMPDTVEHLRNTPIFKDLDEDELGEVAQIFR